MNQASSKSQSRQQTAWQQHQKIPTLYTTCLNYVCTNIELVTRAIKTTNSKNNNNTGGGHHRHHNHGGAALEFRQKTAVALNHVISEDLIERLSAFNKINDSTLSLFATSSSMCCLKKLSLKNCLVGKDTLKLILKHQNIDELTLNNIQIQVAQSQLSHGGSSTVNSSIHHHMDVLNHLNLNQDEIISSPQIAHGATAINPSPAPQPTIIQSMLNINELVESLNPWSQANLKSLNLARNPSLFSSILINMRALGHSLTRLNVSFTSFNNHSLDILCQDLPRIEYLDISGTKVNELGPLSQLANTLRGLYMYHMRASLNDDIVDVVCSLPRLVALDLSCDISTKIFADTNLSLFDVNYLLAELTSAHLQELKYLDISGKTTIKQEVLCDFLRAYPKLKFLGLALTTANSFDIFNRPKYDESSSSAKSSRLTSVVNSTLHLSSSSPSLTRLAAADESSDLSRTKSISKAALSPSVYFDNLIVTGESNEAQTIAALRAYKYRLVYVQKALYHLYILTRNAASADATVSNVMLSTSRQELLEIVVELMQIHSKSQSVQLAATTCIFNLTKDNLYTTITSSHMLTQVINLVLTTMINYPNCQALQRNCLFILVNEEMLNSCNFNKYVCVKATLECLGTFTSDANMTNSSIAICSQAALNAEHKYRIHFGKLNDPKYLQRLVQIINSCIERVANDSILHSVLDILWSLSEENPDWCCNFITQNGLNAYVGLIDIFENDTEVVRKSMNMLYNLSEIAQIRPILFCHPIANVVKRMLYHEDQRLSFLSVGFFVNLLAYMPDSNWDWHASLINPSKISDFKQELENIIENWSLVETSNSQIFLHHSRTSLMRLLNKIDEPSAQMWAVWAIYFSFRFIPSIESAECVRNAIKSTITDCKSTEKVSNLCSHILELIQMTNFIKC